MDDRISTLPDTVLFHILSFLPIDEIVATSVLSKRYLSELLSGCPVLDDLEAVDLYFDNCHGHDKKLHSRRVFALKGTENVIYIFLFFIFKENGISDILILSLLQMNGVHWLDIIEVLQHCPKFQILALHQEFVHRHGQEVDCSCPLSVPESISLNLKTCCLTNYKGSKGEVRFVRYVMQNARLLRSMTISVVEAVKLEEKLEMITKLSLCTRLSATCELAFK
ncbi:putative FBD-associated F-box protein At5g56430 [Gastrolobium bilobum]|uniref:putative FBD-associated F-box protein At5g56430 n=1 Tax=Gastrolobium bilobum TaxID=150636 RepID=UPI002AB12A17|nr:putative FBD-associated F-box protein At5g56430 [Gastrolobium bilobum]